MATDPGHEAAMSGIGSAARRGARGNDQRATFLTGGPDGLAGLVAGVWWAQSLEWACGYGVRVRVYAGSCCAVAADEPAGREELA